MENSDAKIVINKFIPIFYRFLKENHKYHFYKFTQLGNSDSFYRNIENIINYRIYKSPLKEFYRDDINGFISNFINISFNWSKANEFLKKDWIFYVKNTSLYKESFG